MFTPLHKRLFGDVEETTGTYKLCLGDMNEVNQIKTPDVWYDYTTNEEMEKINLSIFKNISSGKRAECAVCRKELNAPLIELPHFPLTDIYVKQMVTERIGYVDQNFHICQRCGHGQLSTIIDPGVLYGHAYSFRTSKSLWGSTKANDFFLSFINRTTKNREFKTILEIGCNDLYLLNCLKSRAEKLVGIDPVLKGREEEFSDDKITVIGDFFENIDLPSIDDTLILNSHLLEHIRDPKLMIEKLLENSTEKTLFVFQFPGFDTLVEECRFDQIYHHHLHYFSLHSFVYLLNELGGELIDAEVNRHYWGSLLVAFRKSAKRNINPNADKISSERVLQNYDIFQKRMDITNKYLQSLASEGERLIGYGAGLQLPVLGYHLNNDFSSLDCVVDDDENKDGLFYINLPVPIRSSTVINNLEDATVIITAINFSRGILLKLIPLNPKRIVLPLNV